MWHTVATQGPKHHVIYGLASWVRDLLRVSVHESPVCSRQLSPTWTRRALAHTALAVGFATLPSLVRRARNEEGQITSFLGVPRRDTICSVFWGGTNGLWCGPWICFFFFKRPSLLSKEITWGPALKSSALVFVCLPLCVCVCECRNSSLALQPCLALQPWRQNSGKLEFCVCVSAEIAVWLCNPV